MDDGTRIVVIAASATFVVGMLSVGGILASIFLQDIFDGTPDDGGPYDDDGGRPNDYPGPPPGEIVGYWRFDEDSWKGEPGEVMDHSGDGNDGHRDGSVRPLKNGISGNAADFDGRGSILIDDGGRLDITGELTVSAWIRTGARDTYMSILDRHHLIEDLGDEAVESGFSFYLTDGKIRLSIYSAYAGQKSALGETDLRDSMWHHVIGLWDGFDIKVYVDGEIEDMNGWTYPPASSPATLTIGERREGWGGYMPFRGLMDEVCIYDEALDEVAIGS